MILIVPSGPALRIEDCLGGKCVGMRINDQDNSSSLVVLKKETRNLLGCETVF